MFVLLGDSESAARANADTIMRIENRLALASKRPVDLRDPVANYNKVSVADLDKTTPNIDWETFSKELGVPAFTEVNVGQPEYFKELSKAVGDVPVDDWKTYLRWQVLRRSAPRLAKPFDDENFSFYSTVLRGTTEQFPRWRRCLIATDQNLGEALGQEYVKQAFTPQAKSKMNQIVADLFAAYKQRLRRSTG